MSQTGRKSKGNGRREESLTPTPPPGGRIVDGDIRVVPGSGGGKEPVAYKVVRQPSAREFVARVSMPDGVGDVRSRDFEVPAAGAALRSSVGSASRAGRRGSRNERVVRVSRGESMMEREDHGSRRAKWDDERSERRRDREREDRIGDERRRDREREDRIGDERRRSQSHRGREEAGDAIHGERGRYREEGDGENRIRRHSHAPRDEKNFEIRRDRGVRRRHSGQDEEKRRTRSVSPKRRDRSKEKQRKRRDSESGIGSGLKKLLPLLPLVFGLMSTYGEPKGGWDQYIPEEKRKGKGELKKMAEDAFDKHHHKIPEEFPRHLHSHSPRSKSADRAYISTRPPRSPSPSRKQERTSQRNRNRDRRASVRPVGNMQEAFNSITPEQGSAITTLTPSPPPRRRRSTREWRLGGYDGADDEDFVVYSAETQEGSGEEVTLPYEIYEPESPVLRGARTFPLSRGSDERGKHGNGGFMSPPTPPSTIH
ncbi:hypothetical protein BKA61DRAFT_84777 [Leptodontidium sp. MPI-SDFR-AT-0119]|nr:hypothetical protein BKA61DRAFT_84777 [Leptodontidium sp. MPI-SDFR-AT-0119]